MITEKKPNLIANGRHSVTLRDKKLPIPDVIRPMKDVAHAGHVARYISLRHAQILEMTACRLSTG
jgi:hypothetical protein